MPQPQTGPPPRFCDSCDAVYFTDHDSSVGAAWFVRHGYEAEIAFGVAAARLPETPLVGFRMWLGPGVPREPLLSAIATTLLLEEFLGEAGQSSALAVSSEPATAAQQVVDAVLSELMPYRGDVLVGRTDGPHVRFAFSGNPSIESEMFGAVRPGSEHELLDRMVDVLGATGAICGAIAPGRTIAARVASHYRSFVSDADRSPGTLGVRAWGLPGIGWRTVFGQDLADAIGIDRFRRLGDQAVEQSRCWIVDGGDDFVPGMFTAKEQAAMDVLGAEYFSEPIGQALGSLEARYPVLLAPAPFEHELHTPDGASADAWQLPELRHRRRVAAGDAVRAHRGDLVAAMREVDATLAHMELVDVERSIDVAFDFAAALEASVGAPQKLVSAEASDISPVLDTLGATDGAARCYLLQSGPNPGVFAMTVDRLREVVGPAGLALGSLRIWLPAVRAAMEVRYAPNGESAGYTIWRTA